MKFQCKFLGTVTVKNVKGCLVQLISKSDSSRFYTNNSTTTENNVTAVLIYDVPEGEYRLEGYIIELTDSDVLAYIDDNLNFTSDSPTTTPHTISRQTGS